MENLNCEALDAAVSQLEKGIHEAASHPHHELMRDGVIQRFEYTMDLSWKMIQRYFKLIQLDEALIRSKNDLFRQAAKLQLIEDAEAWIKHYAARNETSHDYDTKKANLVYQQALLFLGDAQKFLQVLRHVA